MRLCLKFWGGKVVDCVVQKVGVQTYGGGLWYTWCVWDPRSDRDNSLWWRRWKYAAIRHLNVLMRGSSFATNKNHKRVIKFILTSSLQPAYPLVCVLFRRNNTITFRLEVAKPYLDALCFRTSICITSCNWFLDEPTQILGFEQLHLRSQRWTMPNFGCM